MATVDLMYALILPILRNVTGWLENAFQDGKIDKYEWRQLGETLVKLGAPVLMVWIGVEIANLDPIITIMTSLVVVLIDWLYSKYAKPSATVQK